ncbi:hypothetical protein [Macrococcus epidermidis]|uniref:hypothetical protein n=1 Tax=Macrococcus epidermidis TaxID=1902580 RepID=UPI0020B8D9E4|nr:hypothetical protein [Macrococcus epidermidis]UTH16728.1 hypothetical protein KFV12_02855 [Macrococcus epidermidis]
MKKMLTVILAGSMLVGLTGTHDAEAGTKLNLLSKSTISKAKAGKLTLDGVQLGKSIGYYKGKKGYRIYELPYYPLNKDVDCVVTGKYGEGIAHFTSHRPINKRYITQLTYSPKTEKYNISTIRKYYGKPITSAYYGYTMDGTVELKVDYYKNVRFQYLRHVDMVTKKRLTPYILYKAQLTKSNTLQKVYGWKRIDKKYGIFSGGPAVLTKSEWK